MMRASSRAILLIACLVSVVPGCRHGDKSEPAKNEASGRAGDPVAKVNGIAVSQTRFDADYAALVERSSKAGRTLDAASRERLRDDALRRLVEAEIYRQEADKLGIRVSPEEVETKWHAFQAQHGPDANRQGVREDFEAGLLREKVQAKIGEAVTVSGDEVKDFYEKNPARYADPEQVRLEQILIIVPAAAPAEEKAQKNKIAEAILEKATAKAADFAAVAAEYQASGARQSTGWFTRSALVKPLADAVWAMKIGEVRLVETPVGYHVAKKIEHSAAREKPLDEVRQRIEATLIAQKRDETVRSALAKWKGEAKIEIFRKPDAAS